MRILFITALLGTILISVSCKKKTAPTATSPTVQKGITYPDSIYNGQSILTLPDSTILVDSKTYGFAANLEKDASLSIVITDLITTVDPVTGHMPEWFFGTTTGWTAQNWTSSNTQKFTATQTGKIDLAIQFSAYGKNGKCRLDFYENSSTITKTKYLKWQ